MVGRGTRRRVRTSRSSRQLQREITRVSEGAPVRIRIPFEPPMIHTSFRITRKLQVLLTYNKLITIPNNFDYGSAEESASMTTIPQGGNTEFMAFTLTLTNLGRLLTNSLFRSDFTTDKDQILFTSISLEKVAVWGPTLIGNNATFPVELSVINTVEGQTDASNSVTVSDIGDRNHRSHVGVSLPRKYWHSCSNKIAKKDSNIIFVQIGESGIGKFWSSNLKDYDLLGVMHITITGIAAKSAAAIATSLQQCHIAESDEEDYELVRTRKVDTRFPDHRVVKPLNTKVD